MMKKFKKGSLFALFLSAALLVSCNGDPAETGQDTSPVIEEETVAEEAEEILLVENGEAVYTIIRPEDATQYEIDEAIRFRKALAEKTGVKFRLATDWEEADPALKEISVGITNRTAESSVDQLGVLEYRIVVNGNKIDICSYSESGLRAAIDAFLADGYITVDGSTTASIPDTTVSGTITLGNGEAPPFTYGEIEGVYECANDTVVLKAKNTTVENYREYVEMLKGLGFTEYASNKIKENEYITLTNDTTTINCYYMPNSGITRVVSEPKGPLYVRAEDNKYTDAGIQSLLTGMKGETVVASEGMGYIIRLCDGSFVIIDGGMGDPDSVDSDKLMNILMEQKPEDVEKPVIAAWLFTHLHGDHVGVFNCFSIDHHDEVVIEAFYYNFPTEEQIDHSDSPYMNDDTIYRFTQFKKCMAEYYPEVPNIKVHTGNKFFVRNAEFEVLVTLEDILPLTIADVGMNESDTLFRMTLGGQTTMWCGDFGFYEDDIAVDEYGDYLKSDILQLAHHGSNGTVEFYSLIDPQYVLLPISWLGGYQGQMRHEQNKWVADSPNLRHLICTEFGTWTIRLPYDPVEGTFEKLPGRRTVYPTYPDLLGE